jgi:hypothetical protein
MAYGVPTRSGKVDERAWCLECEWSNANYKNALATAARHAKASGHEVHCEQGISIVYNPKSEKPDA